MPLGKVRCSRRNIEGCLRVSHYFKRLLCVSCARKFSPRNYYSVPQGQMIHLAFFEPRKSGIKVRNGEVIGGGWIRLTNGRGANLVLLKYVADDLYCHWVVCEVECMPLANPDKIIWQVRNIRETQLYRLVSKTPISTIKFNTQRGWSPFTYRFTDDVAWFFAALIRAALSNN